MTRRAAVYEWTHEFEWHGTDPENKTKKIPRALKFTKLVGVARRAAPRLR